MNLVKVIYDHRVDGAEDLVMHEKEVRLHHELCDIIDNYPWKSEIELFEKYGVGGGFYIFKGDDKVYASYQFVPIDFNKGALYFDLVLKPGFLKLFGRQSVSKDFDIVPIAEAKAKTKDLFSHSIESLYKKYKN